MATRSNYLNTNELSWMHVIPSFEFDSTLKTLYRIYKRFKWLHQFKIVLFRPNKNGRTSWVYSRTRSLMFVDEAQYYGIQRSLSDQYGLFNL